MNIAISWKMGKYLDVKGRSDVMLIVENATIVQFSPPSVEQKMDIVVEKDTIIDCGVGVGKKYMTEEAEIIDAGGAYVSPGLVCSHNHFYSALARGIIANIKPSTDFVSVLRNLWWRLDRALDEEAVYYSGITAALDAVRAGTTAVIDHHASPSYIKGSLSTLARGFLDAGLRGILAYEVTDRNGMDGAIRGVKENVDFATSKNDHLLEAAVGAHAPFTLSEKTMEMLSEAVRSTKGGIHIHVAEDSYDPSVSHHHYGEDVLERLERHGLLDEKAILVHGVFLTDRDIEILNSHDSFLVHNARSNMNNNVGYNSKIGMVKNLALGTDGIGSDMFEEFKMAFFKHRDSGGNMWPPEFLKFLHNGNKILERYFGKQFGRIEKGYTADLVIYDYSNPTPLTGENVGAHLAFGPGSSVVNTVIIGGRVVLRNREFPFDVGDIYKRASVVARRMWETMDRIE